MLHVHRLPMAREVKREGKGERGSAQKGKKKGLQDKRVRSRAETKEQNTLPEAIQREVYDSTRK